MDSLLFENEYLALIERDGYFFVREVRCNGVIVGMIPFRMFNGQVQYLARLEITPPHNDQPELCCITGGLEPEQTLESCAVTELYEESGYRIEKEELLFLGTVRPSKSSDTTVYLFSVDLTRQIQDLPKGDGTRWEQDASVRWLSREEAIQIKDPLHIAGLARVEQIKFQTVTPRRGLRLPSIEVQRVELQLPFGIGGIQIAVDSVQRTAAWLLYVELMTRVSTAPLGDSEGALRETLTSLYSLFQETRKVLRDAGPGSYKGAHSLGAIAIAVLNRGLRPFLSKWHPLLQIHEKKCPPDISSIEHETTWSMNLAMRNELKTLQNNLAIYGDALSEIAGLQL